MKLRTFIQIFPVIIIIFFSFNYCSSPRDPGDKPNIVLLFCDDMGYGDLSVNGNPTIKTPNIDRMCSEGMKFTNFYSGSPACTASRYALLTGRYPMRSGFGWVLVPESPRGIHPKEKTLAEGLKDIGYSTAIFGKWHLGTTKMEYLPLQNGFDEYLGLPYSNDMIPPKWNPIPLIENNDTIGYDPDQTFLTRRYTERAIEFIREHRDEPFFVYLPYAMPHVPLNPGAEFHGTSLRGTYGDVIEEIDWSAGQIIQAIKDESIEDNTLVFFTSDNGPWIIKEIQGGSSGLFRDGKGSTWEGGMHEPGIAWWPGKVPAGEICQSLTSTLDLYSTLLDIAGAVVPDDRPVDGRIATAHLFGGDPLPDAPFFYYGPGKLHAVRLGEWKLHIFTSSQTGKDYFNGRLPLLFNLNEDPSENYDLSMEYPEKVNELMELIRKHEEERIDSGTFWDSDPLN